MSKGSDIAEKPLVLIADDDPDNCSVIQDFLEESGFRVVTAPDGKVAL
jgi:CheY-like chemotaxis protein